MRGRKKGNGKRKRKKSGRSGRKKKRKGTEAVRKKGRREETREEGQWREKFLSLKYVKFTKLYGLKWHYLH